VRGGTTLLYQVEMLAAAVKKAIAPAGSLTWAEAFLVSMAATAGSLPVIAGAYLAKSALGINLMTGPSPLHELLYGFVL
jgi:hypothetical protein